MENIREWAFAICAAAVACGLMQLLLPKSGIQRVFGITSSVFFLSCLLSPAILAPMNLELQPPDQMQQEVERRSQQLEERMEESAGEFASESLRLAAADELGRLSVEYQKIYINIHEDESGSISISECEVELSETYHPRHDEIRAALTKRLGITVRIGYIKE